MAETRQATKEEKEKERQQTEVFFAEIEKLASQPETESFVIAPEEREAFLTAGRRLKKFVENVRTSGAKGGKVVTEKKKAHLRKIAKLPRPSRRKKNE